MKSWFSVMLVLTVLAVVPTSAQAAGPVTYEYSVPASMIVSIDGSWVLFTGTMSVRSRVVGSGPLTRHQTTYRLDLTSVDGRIRSSGEVRRDVRTGPAGASQDHFIYHVRFNEPGRGIVAKIRLHTLSVFSPKGQLVALHATYLP